MKDPKSIQLSGEPSAVMTSFYELQFDRLILIYFDADGLRRGFQFWLGWPARSNGLCNCVPIYFARDRTPLGLDKPIGTSQNNTVILLCLPLVGSISSQDICQLAQISQRENVAPCRLVALFASSRPCAAWLRIWPLPKDLKFNAGSYTAFSDQGNDVVENETHAKRWSLQEVQPRTNGTSRPQEKRRKKSG